ncbi:MAG: Uma2 family endonuclease [Halochromatium sp.]|uniref:Uma2 family endonuclease n=1 Tax=Halochromatium sp. TaxID=2049430 RepID=UPI00397C1774
MPTQNPLRLSDFSEPEPDIALLRPRADFYAKRHPRPEDVLLLIEVAETSLRYDRDKKRCLISAACSSTVATLMKDGTMHALLQYRRSGQA